MNCSSRDSIKLLIALFNCISCSNTTNWSKRKFLSTIDTVTASWEYPDGLHSLHGDRGVLMGQFRRFMMKHS